MERLIATWGYNEMRAPDGCPRSREGDAFGVKCPGCFRVGLSPAAGNAQNLTDIQNIAGQII